MRFLLHLKQLWDSIWIREESDWEKHRKALSQAKGAAASSPNDPQALYELALVYAGGHAPLRVFKPYLERALVIDPDFIPAHVDLGLYEDDDDRAVWHYRQVLRIQPDHKSAHNHLARRFLKMGLEAEAIVELEKAVENWPDNPYIRDELQRLKEKHRGAGQTHEKVSEQKSVVIPSEGGGATQ